MLILLKNYAHENASKRLECLNALDEERTLAMEQAKHAINRIAIIDKLKAAFKSLYDDEGIPEEFIKAWNENNEE